MGLEAITDDCLDQGVTLTDLASVTDCVVTEHECAVERMYLMAHPRAGELLRVAGVAAQARASLSCLPDRGVSGRAARDADTNTLITR